MSKQSQKWLVPTKNPFLNMTLPLTQCNNYSSLNIITQHVRAQSNKSQQKTRKLNDNVLKEKSGLRHFSSTQHISLTEGSNKNRNLSLINNKIESILGNFNRVKQQNQKQKRANREKMKWSKQNKQNEKMGSRQNKQNKQEFFKQQDCKKVQIPTLTFRDINLTNINYPLNSKKQKGDKINTQNSAKYSTIPSLLLPKPSKTKKEFNQTSLKNKQKHGSNLDGLTPDFNKRSIVSLELEELQNSESHIDTLLSNLQKDFLPRNTDFLLYSQQQIKLPKIFRKSKANNQMYKSCAEVHSKIKDSSIECLKSLTIERNSMRRGSISQSLSLIERQLNNFLMALKTQICFDSEFKKMKQWFLYSKIEDKWKKLEQQLRINNLWVNQLTMKVIFLNQNQEGILYQSLFQQEYSIKQLAIAFRAAEEHWNEYILNNFDDKLLKGAGFTENVLDSSKKGYISVGDLIRFLHCKIKEYYYTRDLNMIYLRLKGGERLQYQQLMAKISSNTP